MSNLKNLNNAEIRWLDSGQPYSVQFDDVYHSIHGSLEESEHVFLQGNNLEDRWRAISGEDRLFVIAELGFGTGLNFLLSWRLWNSLKPTRLKLQYLAFEKYPLTLSDLERSLKGKTQLDFFVRQLLQQYPDHTAGIHRLTFDNRIILDLHYGEAEDCLRQIQLSASNKIDCWFLDGFSPKLNPAMWSPDLFQLITTHSKTSATMATYSVAGQVRRDLTKAGFNVTKRGGFAGKREMLVAEIAESIATNPNSIADSWGGRKPWFILPDNKIYQQTAVIIGAGLAGCATAFALSQRGWQVTVMEQAEAIATGASGNKESVLQGRLAAELNPESLYYLLAYLFAHRQFQKISTSMHIEWQNCGVIKCDSGNDNKNTKLSNVYDERVASWLPPEKASERSNIPMNTGGYWLPHGGSLDPRKLCASYLQADSCNPVLVKTGTQIDSLVRENNEWQLRSRNELIASAEVVILANGVEAANFEQTSFLPLTPVRGQSSSMQVTKSSENLSTILASRSYLLPAKEGFHSIGATFDSGGTDTQLREEDDKQNLMGLSSLSDAVDLMNSQVKSARAAVRCCSADFFPVVGQVPDHKRFLEEFSILKRNAKAVPTVSGSYLPGLYVNTAHGSHGLASCPLSAEFLASLIENEPLPLPQSVMDSLSAARFIIRDLKKQR